MEELEGLEKISGAFLRTAKRLLRALVERKSHPNPPDEGTSNGSSADLEPLGPEQQDQLWEFLSAQGVILDRLDRFALGWIDHPYRMPDRLTQQGFSAEVIRKSKLFADRRLAGRLIGPIQTPSGRIVSFWARQIGAPVAGPLYLYWRPDWKAKVPAVWLPTALLRGGRKKGLLVVEDIWEALVLQMHGFLRTVALGESGQPIRPKRLAQFAHLRVPSLTVLLNQTEDFPTRMAQLREVYQRGAWGFRLWLLPPDAMGPYFSPAELLRQQGPETLQKLLVSKRIVVERAQMPAPPKPLPKSEVSPQMPSSKASASSAKTTWNYEHITTRCLAMKMCPIHLCPETDCFCFD